MEYPRDSTEVRAGLSGVTLVSMSVSAWMSCSAMCMASKSIVSFLEVRLRTLREATFCIWWFQSLNILEGHRCGGDRCVESWCYGGD